MNLRTSLLALVCGLASIAPLTTLADNPLEASRLIRSSASPAVYYALPDGRRFTFPNERIFRSWYADFSRVETVSPEVLASYRLAGAVVYRPGTLIKLTTDPKVYLVTDGGELRWVETENIARTLFGTGWASQIQDLSDTFFPAYRVGASIGPSTTFSLSEILGSPNQRGILENQRLIGDVMASSTPTTPSIPTSTPPTPQPSLSFVASDVGVLPGDAIRVDAFSIRKTPESITITNNGVIVKSCSQQGTCSYSFTHELNSSITTYTLNAEARFADGAIITQQLRIPVRDAQGGAARLFLSKTETRPASPVDIRAEWKNLSNPARKLTILIDDMDAKLCFDVTQCTYIFPGEGAIGSQHKVQLIAEDTSGNRWTTSAQTIAIVQNERPIITAGGSATTAYTGELVEINGQASDDDTIREMRILENDTLVATCARASCQYITPILTNPGRLIYTIIAQDGQGNESRSILDPITILPRS